ncbi:MAG TPA: response regulator, partial [Blastocatellia bacterium]|nr:response regulator [Blastocatellia bacterium]
MDQVRLKDTEEAILSSREPRLLIVNDSPVQLEALQRMLAKQGYEVRKQGNAILGWEVLRTWLPDLVISDVVMPGMGGVEFCRKIKTDPATSHIPVL